MNRSSPVNANPALLGGPAWRASAARYSPGPARRLHQGSPGSPGPPHDPGPGQLARSSRRPRTATGAPRWPGPRPRARPGSGTGSGRSARPGPRPRRGEEPIHQGAPSHDPRTGRWRLELGRHQTEGQPRRQPPFALQDQPGTRLAPQLHPKREAGVPALLNAQVLHETRTSPRGSHREGPAACLGPPSRQWQHKRAGPSTLALWRDRSLRRCWGRLDPRLSGSRRRRGCWGRRGWRGQSGRGHIGHRHGHDHQRHHRQPVRGQQQGGQQDRGQRQPEQHHRHRPDAHGHPGDQRQPGRWDSVIPPAAPRNIAGNTGPPRKPASDAP
jgi:hypothetical protein